MKILLFVFVITLLLLSGCGEKATETEDSTQAVLSDPYPLNDASGISPTTDLMWTCTTNNGELLSYNIYFGTDSLLYDGDKIFSNESDSLCNPGPLDYATTYYWKIEAGDGVYFKEGDVWSFTTMDQIEGMILVESGTFDMGDQFDRAENDELPVHEVTLGSYLIGEYEVTQGEYYAVMGRNPIHDHGRGYYHPEYNVSWFEAVEYCNALSIQEGFTPCYNLSDWSCNFNADGYRLPTEAEWEYAARGGIYWTYNNKYSGTTLYLWSVAIYGVVYPVPVEVGTLISNQLDIYDMSGNVWEWCHDWYSDIYYFSSPVNDPSGPENGEYRVKRGGSWGYNAASCEVANRSEYEPGTQTPYVGFRVVRSYSY